MNTCYDYFVIGIMPVVCVLITLYVVYSGRVKERFDDLNVVPYKNAN